MRKSFISLLLLFAIGNKLFAGVEEVQITWNAFKCLATCAPLIERNLNSIGSVSDVRIDAQSGTAFMKWDSTTPFSYEPFRLAASAAGIRIRQMRIRVSGKITHEADQFYIHSDGDNSRFLLLGPIKTEPGRYIPNYNFETHPLTTQDQQKFFKAELNGSTVVISGPLYIPSYWPRVLITEQVKIK